MSILTRTILPFSYQFAQYLSDLVIDSSAVTQLKKLNENSLRITVEGGGCSGFQYTFDLDSAVNSDDLIFEKDGIKIITDEMSLSFIKGSTVEYHEELIRAAFRVVDNPQAEQGCSCGISFTVKLD